MDDTLLIHRCCYFVSGLLFMVSDFELLFLQRTCSCKKFVHLDEQFYGYVNLHTKSLVYGNVALDHTPSLRHVGTYYCGASSTLHVPQHVGPVQVLSCLKTSPNW